MLDPVMIVPLKVGADVAVLPMLYRWGPAKHPPTDAGYLQRTHQGSKAGLRPYAPCDLRVHRDAASDDLVLSWKRRTRLNGDSWEQEEVPLIEESEKYRLQILSDDGASVVRGKVVATPACTYTAAEQVADFGATRRTLRLRVAQFGAAYGTYGARFRGHSA